MSEFENMLKFQPVAFTSRKFRGTCEGISPRVSGLRIIGYACPPKLVLSPVVRRENKMDIVTLLLHRPDHRSLIQWQAGTVAVPPFEFDEISSSLQRYTGNANLFPVHIADSRRCIGITPEDQRARIIKDWL